MTKILIDEATVKLALEVLKQIDDAMPFPIAKLAQAALREALAEQPARCAPAEDGVCESLDCPNHKPAQQEPVACPTCGEYEPRTGTCGTSPSDKRALCNRGTSPQAQQEPVAWLQIGLAPFHDGDVIARTIKPTKWNSEWWRFEPLYTTPQPAQRKPLTDEEIEALLPEPDGTAEVDSVRVLVAPGLYGTEYSEADAWTKESVIQVARAIEAAHGIKEQK